MTDADPIGALTIREAADYAGRTPETIRRWVWSGRLTAHKQGNRLVVPRADVEHLAGAIAADTLSAWRQRLVATKALERVGTRRSAADLVLADRRHRSSS